MSQKKPMQKSKVTPNAKKSKMKAETANDPVLKLYLHEERLKQYLADPAKSTRRRK
jgi:hypothetical protein